MYYYYLFWVFKLKQPSNYFFWRDPPVKNLSIYLWENIIGSHFSTKYTDTTFILFLM